MLLVLCLGRKPFERWKLASLLKASVFDLLLQNSLVFVWYIILFSCTEFLLLGFAFSSAHRARFSCTFVLVVLLLVHNKRMTSMLKSISCMWATFTYVGHVKVWRSWLMGYCLCLIRSAWKKWGTKKETVVVKLQKSMSDKIVKYFQWTKNVWAYNFLNVFFGKGRYLLLSRSDKVATTGHR